MVQLPAEAIRGGEPEANDWTPCGELLEGEQALAYYRRLMGFDEATEVSVFRWTLTVDGQSTTWPQDAESSGDWSTWPAVWAVPAGKLMHLRGEMHTRNPDAHYVVEFERQSVRGLHLTADLLLLPACVDVPQTAATAAVTSTAACAPASPCGKVAVRVFARDALDQAPLPRPAEGDFVLTTPTRVAVSCRPGARWGEVEAGLAPYLDDGSLSFDLRPTPIAGPTSECGDWAYVYADIHEPTRISGLLLQLEALKRTAGPLDEYVVYRAIDGEAMDSGR